jgi:hypothetical protein
LDRNASTDSRTLSRFDEVTLAISQNGSTLNVSYRGKRKNKVRIHDWSISQTGAAKKALILSETCGGGARLIGLMATSSPNTL